MKTMRRRKYTMRGDGDGNALRAVRSSGECGEYSEAFFLFSEGLFDNEPPLREEPPWLDIFRECYL